MPDGSRPTPVPILLYHSVGGTTAPAFQPWTVTSGQFEAQISHLRNHGYTPLTVSGLITRRKANTLPPSPVVITFDDGFSDFYTTALPILEDYDCGATLYITTGYVGGTSSWLGKLGAGDRPMLSWEQVSALPDRGIECGAHTRSHPMLDIVSLAQAKSEIAGSKQALEQVLEVPVESFAYPHGYRSLRVRQLVAALGFTSACSVKHAMSSTEDDPFDLARIVITANTDLPQFAALLAGDGVLPAARRDDWKVLAWRQARRASQLLRSGRNRLPAAQSDSARWS